MHVENIKKIIIFLLIAILFIISQIGISHAGHSRHKTDRITLRPESININLIVEDKKLHDFMEEEQEDSSGGTIYVNAGYHEKGDMADYKHNGVVWGNVDNNLCDATLLIRDINKKSISGKYKIIIEREGQGDVKIWKGPQDEVVNGKEYPVTISDFYLELKIEGINGSSFTNDITITAEFISDDPDIPCTSKDEVKMTVIETKFMLTFDDGPTQYCEVVVNKLKLFKNEDGKSVKAAFFEVGCNSNGGIDCPECLSLNPSIPPLSPYPILIPRMFPFDCGAESRGNIRDVPEITQFIINNFHFIGNHTYCHTHYVWWRPDNQNFIENDIKLWESVVSENNIELQGQPKLFRFPYLDSTPDAVNAVIKNNYIIIKGALTGDGCIDFWNSSIEGVIETAKDKLREWRNKNNLNSKWQIDLEPKEPRVLIFHSSQNKTANNIDRIIDELQNAGFILTSFDIKHLHDQIIKP